MSRADVYQGSASAWREQELVVRVAQCVILAAFVLTGAGVGYLLGFVDGARSDNRTLTAVCQELDQMGADPSSAVVVESCPPMPVVAP